MKTKHIPVLIAIGLMIGWQAISRYAGWSFTKYIGVAMTACAIGAAVWVLIDQIVFRVTTKGSLARMILALDDDSREEFFARVGISTPEDKAYILDLSAEIAKGAFLRIVLSGDEQQLSQFLAKYKIPEKRVRECALRLRETKGASN